VLASLVSVGGAVRLQWGWCTSPCECELLLEMWGNSRCLSAHPSAVALSTVMWWMYYKYCDMGTLVLLTRLKSSQNEVRAQFLYLCVCVCVCVQSVNQSDTHFFPVCVAVAVEYQVQKERLLLLLRYVQLKKQFLCFIMLGSGFPSNATLVWIFYLVTATCFGLMTIFMVIRPKHDHLHGHKTETCSGF
jgi:hypothetical protein